MKILVWLLLKFRNLSVDWDGCRKKEIRDAKGRIVKFKRTEKINLDLLYRR